MRRWVCAGVLGLVACGPPQAAQDAGETQEGSESPAESSGGESSGAELETTTSDPSDTETGTDSDTDTDTGVDFVPPDDSATGDPCDVFEQDCPEGDKCIPSFAGQENFTCVPVTGDKPVGDACFVFEGQVDDCDANSHCGQASLNDQGEYEGTCVPFCQGTWDDAWCSGQGESCDDFRCVFFGQVGIPICVQTCDPYLADCADAGHNCHFEAGYVDDFICMVTTIEAQLGEPCDWTNDCAAGLYCSFAESLPSCSDARCCTPYCELGDDAGCAAKVMGTVCSGPLMWSAPAVEGCSEVGVCSL